VSIPPPFALSFPSCLPSESLGSPFFFYGQKLSSYILAEVTQVNSISVSPSPAHCRARLLSITYRSGASHLRVAPTVWGVPSEKGRGTCSPKTEPVTMRVRPAAPDGQKEKGSR
jgi:hypothetical protein